MSEQQENWDWWLTKVVNEVEYTMSMGIDRNTVYDSIIKRNPNIFQNHKPRLLLELIFDEYQTYESSLSDDEIPF